MGSPQDAALRHRLNSIRAVIQSFEADLGAASLVGKPDIELLIAFFTDAEKNAKNEIELHELTHGGIDARRLACAHPELHVTNAPAPPAAIGDWTSHRPRRTREEQIASKKAKLESDLQKAEARSSELKRTIDDWYLHSLPEWDRVTASARTRWTNRQKLAIEQYDALKSHYERLLALQERVATPEDRERRGVFPFSASNSLQAWKLIETDFLLRLQVITPKWDEQLRREINSIKAANPDGARVQLELEHTKMRAEWNYQTCCEIWQIQGRAKCRPFFRAIFDWCLVPLFACRESRLKGDALPPALSKRKALDSTHLRAFSMAMGKVKAEWNTRLEIATRDAENQERLAREREAQKNFTRRVFEEAFGELSPKPSSPFEAWKELQRPVAPAIPNAAERYVDDLRYQRFVGPPQVSSERVSNSATANRTRKQPTRNLTRSEKKRRSLIFGAIEDGLKGSRYCSSLANRGLRVPQNWQEAGCPVTYTEAYKLTEWRKRIHDEKHRFQKKYAAASQTERMAIIDDEPGTRRTRH